MFRASVRDAGSIREVPYIVTVGSRKLSCRGPIVNPRTMEIGAN